MKASEELKGFVCRLPMDMQKIEMIALGDVHYGNPFISMSHFDKTVKYILDNPNVFCMGIGDLCESSLRTSKGDIYKQAGTPQDQRDWIIEKLYPIRNKILGMVTGNHEERIYKEVGIDISADIAKALETDYRNTGLALKIYFGSGYERRPNSQYLFKVYAQHGHGGARTSAAKAAKVERMSNYVDADLYAMAHDHTVNATRIPYLHYSSRNYKTIINGRDIEMFTMTEKPKMLLKTNAYVKWGGYAEAGGYSPNDLTAPIAKIGVDEGKLEVRVLV